MTLQRTWPLLLLALALAGPARGEDAAAPAQAPARAPRVRASHQVEVIAPGERIETVVGRMRTAEEARPSTAPATPAVRPPATGDPERAPAPMPMRGPEAPGAAGKAAAGGGTGGGTAPPPRSNTPPRPPPPTPPPGG